ncbi:hypothetical protein [Thalassobius sp. I31.1]|uniref:hypothetical protein n=1 Tax=Thalassobius sp. I31.1 TaxID=2109912 RepID=UPI000D1A3269|nr:hypothetical protein [Thalassobius sp. I31.1]
MAKILLAANYITNTDSTAAGWIGVEDSGHLQLVYEGGGAPREMEVQAPSLVTLGDWQYPTFSRIHGGQNTDYVNEQGLVLNPNRYASIELDLPFGQDPNGVWQLLSQVHDSFILHGSNINYDIEQNSNTYINTVLSIVGIDLDAALLHSVTPEDV